MVSWLRWESVMVLASLLTTASCAFSALDQQIMTDLSAEMEMQVPLALLDPMENVVYVTRAELVPAHPVERHASQAPSTDGAAALQDADGREKYRKEENAK